MSAASFRAFCKRVGYPLEPFQSKIASACFAPERETLVLLARGEAKSSLAALLSVHHLVTVRDPAVYIASTSRDEARTIFETARVYAQHPSVADKLVLRHLEMRVRNGGHLRVVASDARRAYSLSPTLVLLDELHAFADDSLYVTMRSSLHKVPGARMIVLSAAAEDASTPLSKLRQRALAQPNVRRRGGLTEAWGGSIRMIEWAVPEDADVDDPRIVKRYAAPASWVTVEAIREQREALPDLAFRRFLANQWVGRQGAWLPPGAWNACEGTTTFTPGERIWIGADLGGGERSTSAVVYLNEHLHVGCEIFDGDSSATDAAEFISEIAETFSIVECAFDPWQSAVIAEAMEQRGITAVQFPQTDSRMQPASERLHRAVVERRLVHDGDPALAAHVHAATAKQTRRGWRLHRPGPDPIDAAVALAMALDRAEQVQEPVQLLGWL